MELQPLFVFAALVPWGCVAGAPSSRGEVADVTPAAPPDAGGALECHGRADCSGGEICCASRRAVGGFVSRCSDGCPGDSDEGTMLCDGAATNDECRVLDQQCVPYPEIAGESHCTPR